MAGVTPAKTMENQSNLRFVCRLYADVFFSCFFHLFPQHFHVPKSQVQPALHHFWAFTLFITH